MEQPEWSAHMLRVGAGRHGRVEIVVTKSWLGFRKIESRHDRVPGESHDHPTTDFNHSDGKP